MRLRYVNVRDLFLVKSDGAERMFSRGVRNLFFLIMLSCAVSFVNAQTENLYTGDYDSLTALSVTSELTSIYSAKQESTLPCSSEDINIFRDQVLKPPSFDSYSASLGGVETLPPVPATMLMTLLGFACVSLVKDRKVYIAALSSIIWLGQAGVHALPHISFHLKDTKQKLSQRTQCLHKPSETYCLQSETESRRYISLLHYLEGIPARTTSINLINTIEILKKHQQFTVGEHGFSAHVISDFFDSVSSPCLKSVFSRDTWCFTPAFIFQSIPRGPPSLS